MEPSWAVLGTSWAVLGPSGAVLGPSWGPLGPSWGGLRGLLGRLGASESRINEKTKNIGKPMTIKDVGLSGCPWEASQRPLGASWVPLRQFQTHCGPPETPGGRLEGILGPSGAAGTAVQGVSRGVWRGSKGAPGPGSRICGRGPGPGAPGPGPPLCVCVCVYIYICVKHPGVEPQERGNL